MKNSPSKSPLRRLVEQESGYEVLISASAWHSLAKRAGKNGVPLSVVEQVYARGYLTADYDRNGTLEQQAFQRVDSFIHGGEAQSLDEDLIQEIKVPDGSRHMHIIRKAIKRYESKKNPLKEDTRQTEAGAAAAHVINKGLSKAIQRKRTGNSEDDEIAKRLHRNRINRKVKEIEHSQGIDDSSGKSAMTVKLKRLGKYGAKSAYKAVHLKNKDELKQRQANQGKKYKDDRDRETVLKYQIKTHKQDVKDQKKKHTITATQYQKKLASLDAKDKASGAFSDKSAKLKAWKEKQKNKPGVLSKHGLIKKKTSIG